LSEAVLHPHGTVGVSVMVQESDRAGNKALRHITSNLNKVFKCFMASNIFGVPHLATFLCKIALLTFHPVYGTSTYYIITHTIHKILCLYHDFLFQPIYFKEQEIDFKKLSQIYTDVEVEI
jgi:hypothetical protein